MNENAGSTASLIIIQNATMETRVQRLDAEVKNIWILGRSGSDIPIDDPLVSQQHGCFRYRNGEWTYEDLLSTNGTFINGRHMIHETSEIPLTDGLVLAVDAAFCSGASKKMGSVMIFCEEDCSDQVWKAIPFPQEGELLAGRDPECGLCIKNPLISRRHGVFYRENGVPCYRDLHSMNGTLLSDAVLKGPTYLREKDVLMLGHTKILYQNDMLVTLMPGSGSHLVIRGLTKTVADSEHRGAKKTILRDVNLRVGSSELVAVLGTSGAGKTTFLNCVNGYEKATSGSVLLNGVDLYSNKKLLRTQVGYVPQEDLLRGGLSVWSTLDYIARLRLLKDVTKNERREVIGEALDMLGLEPELQSSRISKLSGGQRKRVSIASELISDPPLLFLDEPTSGLDPETETNLILQLRELAHQRHKTLIVITHTLKNIQRFDKILFLGPGGRACFYGTPAEGLNWFQVDDLIEAYPKVRTRTDDYAQRYNHYFYKRTEGPRPL